jgi:hypothetical protein
MLRKNWNGDELTPSYRALADLRHDHVVIALARIILRLLADPAGLVVPSLGPQRSRHRIGERLGVRAGSVPGGSHHEHPPASASA